MPLLVDTYNVLHTVGVLPPELAGVDVNGLIELLHSSRYRDEKTTLVCDGVAQPARRDDPKIAYGSGITIRYSGHGRPADDLIGQLIRASSAPRRLIVVSSDHQVLNAAKRRRCKTLTAQDFLNQLSQDANADRAPASGHKTFKPPSSGMTEDQVNRWMEIFNIDESTVSTVIPAKTSSTASPLIASHESPTSAFAPSPAVVADENPLHSSDSDLPTKVLPDDLIAQAEQLLAQERQVDSSDLPVADVHDERVTQ